MISIQPVQTYQSVNRQTFSATASVTEAANNNQEAATTNPLVNLSATAKAMSTSESLFPMDTNKGNRDIDFNSYFNTAPIAGPVDLDSIPLLLPTANNIAALQEHISSLFPDFLAANDIPEAPSSIRYDASGNLVLPEDYAYADQLKSALENDQALSRELQTANALASHLAGMQQTEPFHEEFIQAETKAEQDAIIEKYSYLFGDNRTYPEITLQFSKSGELSIQADNTALV